MSVDNPASVAAQGADAPAATARSLMRRALKGSLGTLLSASGHPYASLMLTATEPNNTPLFFISRLALHTQNLEKDARASLLIDGTEGLGDPLTGGRLTLIGYARPISSPTALSRFVARHPSAQTYAGFPDFGMYALEIVSGHYIGGFGRIVDLAAADLVRSVADAPELVAAESEIINHMNSDHADAVALYATELAKLPPGEWRLSGVDTDGFDLLHRSNAARIDFPTPVRTPKEARMALIALVQRARAQLNIPPSA